MKSFRTALLIVGAASLLGGCARPPAQAPTAPGPAPAAPGKAAADAPEVNVFVPCGMVNAFRAVEQFYEQKYSQPLKLTVDNAVVLLRKIRSGEKPEVLLSPGRLEMELMEKEGYVDPKSVATFGNFKMIIVVPVKNPAGIQSYRDLAKPSVKSIGLAEPSQNSVGYYGEAALKKLGLYDQVKDRLRLNWHALTAVEWVCTGRIDAGLYFNACPFESGKDKLQGSEETYKIIGELPEDSYPKIQVQAGVLKAATNQDGGKKFVQWMMSAEGQQLLKEQGIPNYPPDAAHKS